jgi:hypothetical protein
VQGFSRNNILIRLIGLMQSEFFRKLQFKVGVAVEMQGSAEACDRCRAGPGFSNNSVMPIRGMSCGCSIINRAKAFSLRYIRPLRS